MTKLITKLTLSLCLVASTLSLTAQAQEITPTGRVAETKTPYKLITVADGMSHPWAVAFLPEGNMLITERPGRIRLIKEGKLVKTPLSGAPKAIAIGQGGMLDLILHPEFKTNRLVYFAYAGSNKDGVHTAIAHAKLKADLTGFEDLKIIFTGSPNKGRGQRFHFGSRMVFLPDGTLIFTIGDGGQQNRSQDKRNYFGNVIRINADGSTPKDNPFVGKADAKPEIYSYGHRNPQGLAFDPDTKTIWSTEHGARGGDELNKIEPGKNYGWPIATYSVNYSGSEITDKRTLPGVTDPVVVWTPVLAACGLAYYNGDKFPAWQGDLFAGALVQKQVRRIDMKDGKPVFQDAIKIGERVRDVRQGPNGYLWVLTDDRKNGKLIRIEPK